MDLTAAFAGQMSQAGLKPQTHMPELIFGFLVVFVGLLVGTAPAEPTALPCLRIFLDLQ